MKIYVYKETYSFKYFLLQLICDIVCVYFNTTLLSSSCLFYIVCRLKRLRSILIHISLNDIFPIHKC